MMGYIAQGNLNIRIHRDITGLPKVASGKPARRVVWKVKCGMGWGRVDIRFLANLIFYSFVICHPSLAFHVDRKALKSL